MSELPFEDPDAFARRIITAMYERDRASRALGFELLEVRRGFARVGFVVRDDMLNALGSCHGGFVFALADSAFAYACNGRNQVNVALQCSISFVAPSPLGTRLEARAVELARGGRTGTYDVDVTGTDGVTVAYFRGTSYRVNAAIVPEVEAS